MGNNISTNNAAYQHDEAYEMSALSHTQDPANPTSLAYPQSAQSEPEPEQANPDEASLFLTKNRSDQAGPTGGENQLGNTQPDLRQNEMEMRKAADTSDGRQPDALQNHDNKFGFLPDHFKEGVVKGDNQKSAEQLSAMMPQSLQFGGHLKRLMLEPDPAHQGAGHQVNENTLYESAAALQHAQQNGYDLASVGRHSAGVDFHANDKNGKQVLFDPFQSPKLKSPPNVLATRKRELADLQAQRAQHGLTADKQKDLDKQIKKKEDNIKGLESPEKQYSTTPKKWADDAYTKHTNNSKSGDGRPVTGIWDTTATTHDQMKPLHNAVSGREGNVAEVDLNLAAEFTKEDHQARMEMLNKIEQGDTKPQEKMNVDQDAFKGKASDFLS